LFYGVILTVKFYLFCEILPSRSSVDDTLGFLRRKFWFNPGLLNVGIVVVKVSMELVYHEVSSTPPY